LSAREFPSSAEEAEEGWPRHQKENGAATFDGADGVVLVKWMHDFLTNTTPSARADVASRFFLLRAATPPQLRRGAALTKRFVNLDSCAAEEGEPRHQKENGAATFGGADGVVLVKRMHVC